MAEPSQPSEIAREVLLRLAQRRTPPTPDNYQTLYHEISGTAAAEVFPEKSLKALVSALPRQTVEQGKLARQLEQAVLSGHWDALKQALTDLCLKAGGEPPPWATLLRELLIQLEARTAGLTPAKKRESLDVVLNASPPPDLLFQRLQSLVKTWSQAPTDDSQVAAVVEEVAAPIIDKASPVAPTAAAPLEFQDLIAQLLENAVVPLLGDAQELTKEAGGLASEIRAARTAPQLAAFVGRLKKFGYRLQFVAEDQVELKAALTHLLQLIVENISELVVDDQWLHGQITVVADLVAQPVSLRQLDDVERRLKDVIYKQGALKKNLADARERFKSMLATFVDRLADFSSTTGDYHDKIERCAERISQATDIAELTDVLDEVMRETRSIQLTAQNSKDELTTMRLRVDEAEKEISRLQNELAQASDMVRHDPLTGALNRKGMDEAIDREVSRTRRHGQGLCIALLDIDNFKKLNDSLGHQAGDEALVHLAQVVRETIRPQDTLARYGGEEFVILLPDTLMDDGISAMTRVQRALTKRFFLHRNEKILITFSCGVAELAQEEAPSTALRRADAAMYLAKRAGKNRVVAA